MGVKLTSILQLVPGASVNGAAPQVELVAMTKLLAPLVTARLLTLNGKLLLLERLTVIGPEVLPAGSLPNDKLGEGGSEAQRLCKWCRRVRLIRRRESPSEPAAG